MFGRRLSKANFLSRCVIMETQTKSCERKFPREARSDLFTWPCPYKTPSPHPTILLSPILAIQRELSAVRRGVSDSATSSSANDGVTSELDDVDQHKIDDSADLKKIETIQSGTEERKVGMKEWRRLKRTPQGSVGSSVIRSYVRPLVLFYL